MKLSIRERLHSAAHSFRAFLLKSGSLPDPFVRMADVVDLGSTVPSSSSE